MRDTYFLDREGNPLGGKIPLQVYSHGGGDAEAVRAEANGLLNAFLENVRQSIAPNHKRTFDLPGGGSMTITSLWGHVKVDLFVPPTEDEGGPFYGGILINPHVITGDQAAYLSLAGNPTPWRVPDAVKTAGAAPGRPAVPGTGSASTEWLVVQIARDLPLTGNPLASGAVRMFRIANPLFGGFCEVAEPGRYAVSTIDGSAFFLCGQQLDHVPPMPGGLPALTRSSEAGGGPSPSRIRTVGMQPASFVDAHAAEGIIIFALVNQLWALNTRERTGSTPAPWRLLAEVEMPRPYPADYLPNEFGAVFTVSVGASTTITCSGTNGVGACSGFSVTITPTDGPPVLSGTLTLVDSGFMRSQPREQTVNFTGSYSRPRAPAVTVDAWDFSVPGMRYSDQHIYNPNFPKVCNPFVDYYGFERTSDLNYASFPNVRHVAYDVLGLSETHSLAVDLIGPSSAIVPDPLLGGVAPRRTTRFTRTFRENGQTNCQFVGFFYRLKGSFALNRWEYYNLETNVTYPDCNADVIGGQTRTVTITKKSYLPQCFSPPWLVYEDTDLSLFLSQTEFVTYYGNAYAALGISVTFLISFLGIEWHTTFPGERDATPGLQKWDEYRWGQLYINTVDINNGRAFIYEDITSTGSPDRDTITGYIDQNTDYRRTLTDTKVTGFYGADGPDSAVARYFPKAPDFTGRRDPPSDFTRRRDPPSGICPFAKTVEFQFSVPTLPPAVYSDTPTLLESHQPGYTAGPVAGTERAHYIGGDIASASGSFLCEAMSRYPKRAAVFSPVESFEISDAYIGSLLGATFVTSKKREGGQLVANEHYTHGLPTNVSGFPTSAAPTTTKSENRMADASGAYDRDPYLRFAYTTRDWHCCSMGWRRDAGRTGSWYVEDRKLLAFANNGETSKVHDTANRVEMAHTLYRAGGATVLTFPDLLSFYPLRSTHGPLTRSRRIANVGAPYVQHDLLYLDAARPALDDSDSFGVPGFGGTVGDAYDLDLGSAFLFDTECIPRRDWSPRGPYRQGWTPNRPQLLVGYWGKDANGGSRNPLFPVPGYWIPNPEPDPPLGEEYIHVPHITEATESNYNLSRPELGFVPDFSLGLWPQGVGGSDGRAAVQPEFYELEARNTLTDIGGSVDVLYVDNRTGGFITQVLWSGNGGRISEAYIGNRTGIVPFRPIFDAWLALGGGAAAEGTKIAIDRPPTSIGGPAPGAINPQPVSLL